MMLLLPRSSASKLLNPPAFFDALCLEALLFGLVVSRVTEEGHITVTPVFPWLVPAWEVLGSSSTQLILMRVSPWRRCCLATREPWELPLGLFPLFFFHFLSLSFVALMHRLRFLTQKHTTCRSFM